MSSCWCDIADDSSTVTKAEDLYQKLAVKPEW